MEIAFERNALCEEAYRVEVGLLAPEGALLAAGAKLPDDGKDAEVMR